MTIPIALLLGLVVVALVLFSFEWVQSDVVALGLLLALIVTGLLPARDAFAGFGSDTVIMIFALLVMTSALLKTGVVDLIARTILRHAGTRVTPLLAVMMIAVAGLSAFISNTAAAALFLPIVIGIAAKAKVSPSSMLMPVAFASILTSSVTLISTSTNLVVSGLMTRAGLAPLGMFELSPVGIPIAVVGLVYMFFIGRRLIPERAPAALLDEFEVRPYITEVLVLPDSSLVGKTLEEANLGRDLDLEVVRVLREPDTYLWPRRQMTLRAGDVLLVKGARKDVLKVKDTVGLEIRPEVTLSDPDLGMADTGLVEALVVPRSPLVGRTLRTVGFRERYRLQVLGLNRHGQNMLEKLGRTVLHVGDVLLVQGPKAAIARVSDDGALSVLNAVDEKRIDRPRAWRAMAIFVGALALAASDVGVPLPVAVLAGAFLIFVTRCITPSDAYREIEWRVIILIACMLALGEAMMKTGTAAYMAEVVAGATANVSPLWLLGGFFALTVALTQPMSNQAAAAVILPIAVQTATHLHLNPRAFAIMIAVAASCSYLTPLEPACLMVYGPGRYRFMDFVRVGAPLTLLIFAIAMLAVPRIWPLQ